MQIHLPTRATSVGARDAEAVLAFLAPLSKDYPHFERWLASKVRPGLVSGERHLVRIDRDGEIAAIGIAKRTDREAKICTVRVTGPYVGRGMGVRIFDELMRWLDTDQPHLTVSEYKRPLFERLFAWYGFTLTGEHAGRYVPGVTEYSYNDGASLGRLKGWHNQTFQDIHAAGDRHL